LILGKIKILYFLCKKPFDKEEQKRLANVYKELSGKEGGTPNGNDGNTDNNENNGSSLTASFCPLKVI
jgi:site-specific DNA-adenine methylase